jgi:Zn-dependent protease with chaperone function
MSARKYGKWMAVSAAAAVCCGAVQTAVSGGKTLTELDGVRRGAYLLLMAVLALAVLCGVVCLIAYVVMLGKEAGGNPGRRLNAPGQDEPTEEKYPMLSIVLTAVAVVLSMAAELAGVYYGAAWKIPQAAGWGLLIGGLAVPALCAVVSVPLVKMWREKWNAQNVQEIRDRLWSYRENEGTADKMLQQLRRIRHGADFYALGLAVCGMASAFGAGVLDEAWGLGTLHLLGGAVVLAAMSQLRFPRKPEVFEPIEECYLKPERYPEMYALARKAAATQQYKGDIKLFIVPGCNAGIAIPQRTVLIQIGVILLNVLSQEELYQVLLHEFGHRAGQRKTRKERLYWGWLANGGTPVMPAWLVYWLFRCPVWRYVQIYRLYDYAAELQEEQNADAAMRRFGNAEAAASELIKTGSYNLFQWEDSAVDFESIYRGAEPRNLTGKEINEFREAMGVRREAWIQLMQNEIPSRAATHPTLRMRLEALGVTDWQVRTDTDSDAWAQERTKATQRIERLIQQDYETHYEERRKEYYLEPMKIIAEWEEKGRPVVAEEYADVMHAMRTLGRTTDAMALCDRAMAELPDSASLEAYYMKGCCLLHRYDPTGLELIYHAMDNNNNFVDEGLDIIGAFCCMTGRQAELDHYRAKAVELQQRARDTYDHMDELNPGDDLSEEHLPEGMLEGVLNFVQSVDDGCVQQVYLVKKTAGEDFSASAVVLRFADGTSGEKKYDVLHKVFRYLDTSSDWYFTLFDYDDVRKVNFAAIPGSCVFDRTTAEVPAE